MRKIRNIEIEKFAKEAILPMNVSVFLFAGLIFIFDNGTLLWRLCHYMALVCLIFSNIIGTFAGTYRIYPELAKVNKEFNKGLPMFIATIIGIAVFDVPAIPFLIAFGYHSIFALIGISLIAITLFAFPAFVVWFCDQKENRTEQSHFQ